MGEVGELVVTRADADDAALLLERSGRHARYHESYFELYPGKWRHGDWIRFTERGALR